MKAQLKTNFLNTKPVGMMFGGTFTILHKVVSRHPDSNVRGDSIRNLEGENPVKFYAGRIRGAYPEEILRDNWNNLYWHQILKGDN